MNKQASDNNLHQENEALGSDIESVDNAMVLTVNLVRAYVTNHTVPAAQLGTLLEQTHRTVLGLSNFCAEPVHAATVEDTVKPDCIMCLEDRKFFRSLKRHLAVHHGLTPDEYRERWNLPPDYPMVAPEYSKSRSQIARSTGFGGKSTRLTVRQRKDK